MRRAGPWYLLLAAACALGQPPPPAALRCQAAGPCFSAHLANSSYPEARSACGRRRGDLAWVSGEEELGLLLGLLAEAADRSAASLFWVGLKRNASACTDGELPLRGFSWEGGGAAPREVPAALGRWAKEPVRSCLTPRCAGLHLPAASSGAGWGWKERPCQRPSQGYACKYQYRGACPDLRPAAALRLDYRLPFEESSAGPGFSPPGTVLSVGCPGGGVVRFTCQPQRGGFAWKGAQDPLCPCGYRSAGSGGDEEPCAAAGATTTAAGGSAGPPAGGEKPAVPPPTSSSPSSSSNYVFILVTVAVVVLVILVMTVLGVFKLCFNKKSEGGGDKEPPEAGSKAEAGCGEPSGEDD